MDQYKLARMHAAEQMDEAERARLARDARDPVQAVARQAFRLARTQLLAAVRWRKTPSRPADAATATGSGIGG
jgi:hypothetical protein